MADLLALHRYFIWANRLWEHFDGVISTMPLSAQPEAIFVDDRGLFLCHWYAALYVVVEGWQELKLADTEIDALLSSPNIDLLRRFRNGVCHYQRNYSDPRFLDLMQAQGVVPWVRQLNLAFGRYFLQWHFMFLLHPQKPKPDEPEQKRISITYAMTCRHTEKTAGLFPPLQFFLFLAVLLSSTTAFALPKGATMTTTDRTKYQTAYLSGGCFWGMEELVRQIPGVLETEVGYTGCAL